MFPNTSQANPEMTTISIYVVNQKIMMMMHDDNKMMMKTKMRCIDQQIPWQSRGEEDIDFLNS